MDPLDIDFLKTGSDHFVDITLDEEGVEPIERCVSPNLQTRLNIAALVAKNTITATSQSIGGSIVVDGLSRSSIVIDCILSPKGERCIVVYNTSTPDTYIESTTADSFKYVYFRRLKECRVFVKCKLLKLMVDSCNNCQISIKESILSTLDMFRCNATNLHIRVKGVKEPIPITTIESCENIGIFQSSEQLCYLIKSCGDIRGTLVDVRTGERKESYNLGKLFWDESEQILVCLSQDEGFASSTLNYELNNIGLSIATVHADKTECFAATPPVPGGMWDRYNDRRSLP